MNDQTADLFDRALRAYQAGELADAADQFQEILSKDPGHADALHMLGVTAYQLGQVDAAAALLEQAVVVRRPFAEAEANLGTVLLALGRTDDAVAALVHAHQEAPENPTIAFNLGNACVDQGNTERAVAAYESAVALQPDHAEAWCQLGLLHRKAGEVAGALAAYQKAIAAKSDFSQAHYNLANVHRDLGRLGDAEAGLRTAIEVRPDYAMAWNSLGTLLGDMGRSQEALTCFDQAVRFAPESSPYASNRLCALQYIDGISNEQLSDAHTEWYWLHVAPTIEAGTPPERVREPDRPLKVGFVSPDFGFHPIGFLTAPLFEHLGGKDIDSFIYSTRAADLDDNLTDRIRTACGVWHSAAELNDQDLAEQIDRDQIDILFDMSGHTSGNRLGVFARKPAPVQISWLGYVGTTGLPAMDYVLGDPHQTPEGSDQTYGESVLRMPDGYACYAPPLDAPDVGGLPALTRGHITFGFLNNPGKLNQAVFENFAAVLERVPQSRLLFRFRGLDDPAVLGPITTAMAALGIAADRLAFEGAAPHADFLETYNRVDIALDPFPYSGGLTTCEAMWMGTPTLTIPGQTFAGRHAASHLRAAGYPEFVAPDRNTMIETASALAADLDSLAEIRANMRAKVQSSPLCDGERFAANFAATLRQAWSAWCEQDPLTTS